MSQPETPTKPIQPETPKKPDQSERKRRGTGTNSGGPRKPQ